MKTIQVSDEAWTTGKVEALKRQVSLRALLEGLIAAAAGETVPATVPAEERKKRVPGGTVESLPEPTEPMTPTVVEPVDMTPGSQGWLSQRCKRLLGRSTLVCGHGRRQHREGSGRCEVCGAGCFGFQEE